MIKRFQIEDLIIQDASGVVFRALDTDHGKTVALRRFFPFGADGGGLQPEEQIAYNIAVGRLAGLRHPALRSIIAGGCDPVDGIPFLVTEWVEGDSLQAHLERGAIPPDVVTALITQALEVCELLSQVLAEQAVWVETDIRTIIVSSPESGRGFTFWISPLKWLGGSDESRGLESIVTLTEVAMDWEGRIVNDQAGRGLGGWLKWLRNTAATTTLQEARESLAASVGADPPPPAKKLLATAGQAPVRQTSSRARLVLALILILMTGLIGGGWLLLRNSSAESPVIINRPPPAGSLASVNQQAAELSARTLLADQQSAAVIAAQEAATKQRGGVIAWEDHELLVQNNGSSVIVEGIVQATDLSGSGKTIYLLFSENDDRDAARAGMRISSDAKDSMTGKFNSFIGKKVRVSGSVKVQKVAGLNRPDIMIDDISAVMLVQ